jgi:hypothetical protein
VDGRIATGPAGSVAVIVISSLVQLTPIAADSSCRAAVTSEPGAGARSCGSRETASPTVTTLPINASRTASGRTAAASREPATVIDRAAATSTGATTSSAPSTTPRLDSVTSSTSTTPGALASSAAAANAELARAPVSRTASQARRPSASSTSGCSRTTPRRVSSADGDSRAVNVICGDDTRRA